MSDDAKTREEREREAWDELQSEYALAAKAGGMTGVAICNRDAFDAMDELDATRVRRLRDALNYRLRELGVDP